MIRSRERVGWSLIFRSRLTLIHRVVSCTEATVHQLQIFSAKRISSFRSISCPSRPMDKLVTLSIRRKISDTLCGEVLECELPRPTDSGHVERETVAVKVISLACASKLQQGADDRTVDCPSREMAVARLLSRTPQQHPHIAEQIFQIACKDVMYLVSEYCGGGDLYSFLDAQRPRHLSELQAADFVRQIAEGVQFLHETVGIAHRDLSLENILLTVDGACKITDFALSVDAGEICHDRAGKDLYMAPEVVARRAYDPIKADVWSLGVVWFVMLTGSPFAPIACPSQGGFRVVERHGIGIILKKWGVDGRISRATAHLLDTMLQVDPRRRPSLQRVLAHPALSRGPSSV